MVTVMEADIFHMHSAWRFGNGLGNLDWQSGQAMDFGITQGQMVCMAKLWHLNRDHTEG